MCVCVFVSVSVFKLRFPTIFTQMAMDQYVY